MEVRAGQLSVVRFRAGGVLFLLEAARVSCMQAQAPAEGRGVSAEQLIGLPLSTTDTGRRWLQIDQRYPLVEVSAPVELQTLEVASIHPLPELVRARIMLSGIQALVLDNGKAGLFVDLPGLLRAAEPESAD
jgi:hypothetical protein